jgi:hypothetical protein
MTLKGFMKCWISSAMDGTDDMVCNGSEEKVHISFWLMPMMLTYWEEAYIL